MFAETTNISPETVILQNSLNPWFSQAIYTIAKLKIADVLADGAKSCSELAVISGTHAPFLHRLLRLLAGYGVLLEDENGSFALTQIGNTLRTDVPNSTRDWIIFNTEAWRWTLLNGLCDVVSTGKSAYENIYHKNIYDVFAEHPNFGQSFNLGMKSWSLSVHAAVPHAYSFSNIKTIVDIGGGMGNLLVSILTAYPHLNSILFELPHVAQQARSFIQGTQVANRCEVIAGDCLKSVPAGGDAYMISSVLMDWTDEQAIDILKNCHSAMKADGKLLIIEPLLGLPNQPSLGKLLDVMIMIETRGRIRSSDEFSSLLDASGFQMTQIFSTGTVGTSVIEAIKIA